MITLTQQVSPPVASGQQRRGGDSASYSVATQPVTPDASGETFPLQSLPGEMMRHIMSFMAAKDLVRLATTCKFFGARAGLQPFSSCCEVAAMDRYQEMLRIHGLQDGPSLAERWDPAFMVNYVSCVVHTAGTVCLYKW